MSADDTTQVNESSARLRDAFDALAELAPSQRSAWLDANVADPGERALLLRLLAADNEAGYLDTPAAEHAARLAAEEITPGGMLGRRIGAFEVLGELGQGGMSAVFLGARVGADFEQRVAIKLLRRGLYSELEQRLFLRERRVLAALDHANIARLIDGGVTDAGIPYLVMEYVDGVTITRHVQLHALDIHARLALFLTVCRAVAAAHRNLIVHRDIKPSNILVSSDGVVKLLDFGIAKLLEDDADTQATGTVGVFTPDYAAPEQIAGTTITTATDVYGLGVLLHEMLLGMRPAGGATRRPSSLIPTRAATVIRGEAAAPVFPVNAARLRKLLRGDLDNVLMKALATEPAQRYATANAFADDIERYLNRKPVLAHPPSRWYRARKFVQRHRGGVAITALFMLGILASLGLALWQANVARNEAARANTVRDFLVGLFDAARAHLPRDQRPTPEALLEQAQKKLDAVEGLDTATHVDLLRTLGEVQLSLANYTRAADMFEQARTLAGGRADSAAALQVLHADALQRAGRNAQAVTELDAALPGLRTTPSAVLVRALGVLASAQLGEGHPEAAIAHRREAEAAARGVYGGHSAEALAAGFETGNTLAQAEFYAEAAAVLPPLLEAWRASHAPQDDRYVAALASLAAASDGLGDKPATEARYHELLALKRTIYAAPHDAIARTLRDLSGILERSEKYAEAEAALNEALAMQKQVFGPYHSEIVATYNGLGEIMVGQRRFAEADGFYRQAIAVCDAGAIKDETCPHVHNDLGMSLYRQNRLDEANTEMNEALRERRALFGDDHPTVAYSLSTLANVAVKQGKFDDAVRLIAQSLDVLERNGRAGSREGALIRHGYAQALWKVERHADALREIDRAIADWGHVAPNAKARHVMMLVQKAQILEDLKQPEQARASANEAIALGADAGELAPNTKNLLRRFSGRTDVYPVEAAAH